MKHTYRKYIILMMLLMLVSAAFAQQPATDQDILEKAKLDLFDRKWQPALEKLDYVLKEFPDSRYYDMALFYKGKCLEEMNKSRQALLCYTLFLEKSENRNLREEATIAIIDLDYRLYTEGDRTLLPQIANFLKSTERTVRYYAAFKISYADDKTIAASAVPVLKKIVADETDSELVDRAKLALMRIAPRWLQETAKKRSLDKQMLNIRIYDKKDKKESLAIAIPFSLARLALESLPDKDKKSMAKEGYDLNRLMRLLTESPEILRIEVEEATFKIWVE